MKIKELIEELNNFDEELDVMINVEIPYGKDSTTNNSDYDTIKIINLENHKDYFKEVWINCTLSVNVKK